MEISTNDISKSMVADKSKILNSSKKQISQVLDGISATANKTTKETSVGVLLDSLFKDLSTNQKSKDVVLKILQDKTIFVDVKNTTTDLKSILNDLKTTKAPLKTVSLLDKLLINIKNLDALTLQKQINQSGLFLESKLANKDVQKTLLPNSIKEPLIALKNIAIQEKLDIKIPLIDKILSAKLANKQFIGNIKELIQSSKVSKNQSTIDVVAKLENIAKASQTVESKISNDMVISTKEIKTFSKQIVDNLNRLDFLKPQIKEDIAKLTQIITKIQNMPNINKADILNLNLSEKLQRSVNLIKTELIISQPKANLHVEVSRIVQALHNGVQAELIAKEIVPNQPLLAPTNLKEEIATDIKANLLYVKDEISKTSNLNMPDTLAKIDKVLTNINYYQLLSFSANANILYLPLVWSGLDEGKISIKKLKQKRYFCEINLKLKDFGKIDLLIMLFDDISINISIFTKSEEFLARIRENLQILKQGINSVGLIPSNIYLYDSLKDDKIKKDTKSYVDAQQIGSGVNIHV